MTAPQPPETLGIRHVALKVKDLESEEKFYTEVLGFIVEWRPDKDNVYLRSHGDNLALHREPARSQTAPGTVSSRSPRRADSVLDHFGIILKKPEDVDAWAAHLKSHGTSLAKEPKTHRDGARSFYTRDPEGIVIQFIFHPPISR